MSSKSGVPYLDFYKKHKISPVEQDISDLQKHFERRTALYRSLGLLPGYFKDKAILEFGPGSGHNALFTKSLAPRKYVLVDGNPVGLERTTALLKKYPLETDNYEVVESFIHDFRSNELFDVVICECTLASQHAPVDFLKHLAGFVKKGGILLVSAGDSVGWLGEILRNFIGLLMIDPKDNIDKKLGILRPIFKPHLDSLKNMSRPIDDWILDNVIQPLLGNLISIPEAITALDGEFEIYGSSPKFLTDWRWYKDIAGSGKKYNEMAIDLANQNTHNFLDYRFTYPPQPIEVNHKIRSLCEAIFMLFKKSTVDFNREHLRSLIHNLKELALTVKKYSPQTAASFEDYAKAVDYYLIHKSFPEFKEFVPFWGRATQYLSFTRG